MGKSVDRLILEGECIIYFRGAVKSKWTLDPYERRLVQFLSANKMTCDQFVSRAKSDTAWAERTIMSWMLGQKKRAENKEISNGTVGNTLKPLKLLLEMNDVTLNWKKVKKLLPGARRFALDRIPTREELTIIIEHSDLRGRALTLVLCSSGIREGAVEHLKVRNLVTIQTGNITLGKLLVYEGDEDQYATFITPEAHQAIQSYLEWRKKHGEYVSAESPLFRDKFDPLIGAYRTYDGGKPEDPKCMNGGAIRAYYNRLFWECKFRTEIKRRHEFSIHGFRKWFKTRCENAGIKPIVTEILMGHSVGISDSYYRPTESELLSEYVKAIDSLTITKLHALEYENIQFAKRNQELEAERAEITRMKAELEPLMELKKVLIKEGVLREDRFS